MIIRIVKMTFKPDAIPDFIKLFYYTQPFIQAFEGCQSVELLNDANNKNQYFTLSYWRSETDLENYRQSTFFIETWAKVKPLFAQKAEAWSLDGTETVI